MSIGGEKSPRSKVKFMCSFGGKILPRPSDGILKYVGGETRVIAVSPDISFSDLMKKLTEITENDNIVLKYQIFPEELDVLVSVKSDEDLKHMLEEYSRQEAPKPRTFLFPSNPVSLENNLGFPIESQSIEQRYIEAINGIVRAPKNTALLRGPIRTRPSFTVSSACSSPRSESSPDHGYYGQEQLPESSYQLSRLYPLPKVKSSPNISQQLQQSHSHHHNAYSQLPPNYLTCRLRPPPTPLDFHRGTGWDQAGHVGNSSGSVGGYWGRASSVPQSPRNHGFRL